MHRVDPRSAAGAQKSWRQALDSTWFSELPPAVQHVVQDHPFCGFYTDKEGKHPVRIYMPIEVTALGKPPVIKFRAASPNKALVERGVEPDEIVRVELYTDAIVKSLKKHHEGSYYLEPDGFLYFLSTARGL